MAVSDAVSLAKRRAQDGVGSKRGAVTRGRPFPGFVGRSGLAPCRRFISRKHHPIGKARRGCPGCEIHDNTGPMNRRRPLRHYFRITAQSTSSGDVAGTSSGGRASHQRRGIVPTIWPHRMWQRSNSASAKAGNHGTSAPAAKVGQPVDRQRLQGVRPRYVATRTMLASRVMRVGS